MAAVLSVLLATAIASAAPLTDSCTGTNLPVLGGIDVVDFQNLKESTWTAAGDKPTIGSTQYTAELNGYTFHFKNAANQAKFKADSWKYAPAWGGF